MRWFTYQPEPLKHSKDQSYKKLLLLEIWYLGPNFLISGLTMIERYWT